MIDKAKEIARQHVFNLMPEELRKLSNAINTDLHYGPISKEEWKEEGVDWPGYVSACKQLQEWIDFAMPSALWVDMDCEFVSDKEPQGYTDEETGDWVEPFLENTFHFEGRSLKRAVFGEMIGNGIG